MYPICTGVQGPPRQSLIKGKTVLVNELVSKQHLYLSRVWMGDWRTVENRSHRLVLMTSSYGFTMAELYVAISVSKN